MSESVPWTEIERRVKAVLAFSASMLKTDDVELLAELNYHGERSLALQMVVEGVAEAKGSLTADQAEEIADLARTMGMNESIADEARSLVR